MESKTPHPFRRRPWAILLAFVLVLAPWTSRAHAQPQRPEPPELHFEAPDRLAPIVERLRAQDTAPLVDMVELLGLEDPGPPIRVVVTPEGSEEARIMPSWGVAYAIGNIGLVVLVPSRVPSYPDNSLEQVLHHEIAHVLIARAAKRRAVPRWFNEGLAMVLAREVHNNWTMGDQGRLVLATVRRDSVSLAELDRFFQQGSHTAGNAYALSGAFVRFLLERHGEWVAADILAGLGRDQTFYEAFRRATGETLVQAEDSYWDHLDLWHKWVPFVTSSATLWVAVTGLALVAFRRRRQRDEEILTEWDEEEERLAEQIQEPTQWIH